MPGTTVAYGSTVLLVLPVLLVLLVVCTFHHALVLRVLAFHFFLVSYFLSNLW